MAEIKVIAQPSIEYVPIPEGAIAGIDGQQIDPATSIEGWANFLKPAAEEESFEIPPNEFKKKYEAGEDVPDIYASSLWDEKAYKAQGQQAITITGGVSSRDSCFDATSKRVVQSYVSGGNMYCRIGVLNEGETAFTFAAASAGIQLDTITYAATIDNTNNKVFAFYGRDYLSGNSRLYYKTGTIDVDNEITWDDNEEFIDGGQNTLSIYDASFTPENDTVILYYKLWNGGYIASLKIDGAGDVQTGESQTSSTFLSYYDSGYDPVNNKFFVCFFSYGSQTAYIRSYSVNSTGDTITPSYNYAVNNCAGGVCGAYNPKDGYVYFRYRYYYNVSVHYIVYKIINLANGSIINTGVDSTSILDASRMFYDNISEKMLFVLDTGGVYDFKFSSSGMVINQDSTSNYAGFRPFDFEGRNLLLNNPYLKYKAEGREKATGVVQTGADKGDLLSLILLGGENSKFTGLNLNDYLYIQTSGLVTTTETDYVIGIAISETTALINKSV